MKLFECMYCLFIIHAAEMFDIAFVFYGRRRICQNCHSTVTKVFPLSLVPACKRVSAANLCKVNDPTVDTLNLVVDTSCFNYFQ